jgi:glyoxylase-like metal-dependent hydrolase (beta-lactamase superfamily II)
MNSNESVKSSPAANNLGEIMPGIYCIRIPLGEERPFALKYVNCYLLKGLKGWTLIDTGWYEEISFKVLKEALAQLNLDFPDISQIILTHVHPDHYGMAGKIKQLSPDIKLYCHRLESDLIESRYINISGPKEVNSFLYKKHGVPEEVIQIIAADSLPALKVITISNPDHMLYGGEIISTGIFDLEVIWTPGHSPGHICLFDNANKLLFCGDHVLPTITPNVGYHSLSGDNPLGDYFNALDKLAHLEIVSVHPGHEGSFTDLKGRAKSIKQHHAKREAEILNLLSHNTYNSYEIAARLTWSLRAPWDKFPPIQKRAAINETIAHLEHSRWLGKIRKIFSDDHISYGPV